MSATAPIRQKLITTAFLGSIPALAILLGLLASTWSLALGLAVLVATPVVLLPLAHNFEPFGPRMREKQDGVIFAACSSGMMGSFRALYRSLPTDPRCRVCLVPFGGVGRVLRITPSKKNSSFCSSCIDSSPEGTYEMEVGVLMADIRGFTAWSESQPASVAADRLTRFYDLANRALMQDDALIEFVGDQVMALYLPGFPSLGDRTADVMRAAAERLVREVREATGSEPLPIGVGLNFGVASVGNVRKGGQKDFTAVGDVVNTAARLQAAAEAGEVVLSESVAGRLAAPLAGDEQRLLEVKGKAEALPVRVVRPE